MLDHPLHEGYGQSRPARLRPDIHPPQHALMPQLDGVLHSQACHANEGRAVHPVTEDRVRFQALGPPRDWLVRLIVPRGREGFRMILQTFKAQFATSYASRRRTLSEIVGVAATGLVMKFI
jgi:hypothetical protein